MIKQTAQLKNGQILQETLYQNNIRMMKKHVKMFNIISH